MSSILVGAAVTNADAASAKKAKHSPAQLRADYLAHLQEKDSPQGNGKTVGSLWSPGANLSDLSTDFKAQKVNDPVTALIAVQTTAAQSGNSNYQRAFSTTSGITALPGDLKLKGVNPLLGANSSTSLKGQGATSSNTTFTTALTGEVIAVLPSGNLVIEAERKVFMNNQHEDIIVRGVVRQADIASNNSISSASLSNLEIEMKGKGIISDSTRNVNPITRAVLWLFGF